MEILINENKILIFLKIGLFIIDGVKKLICFKFERKIERYDFKYEIKIKFDEIDILFVVWGNFFEIINCEDRKFFG